MESKEENGKKYVMARHQCSATEYISSSPGIGIYIFFLQKLYSHKYQI